jgi:hypothetical protein
LLGNIFLTGVTESGSEIASSGAWDSSWNGSYDVFIVKFSSAGTRVWGTYFGGVGDDHVGGIVINESGDVFISGHTESNTSLATSGSWDNSFGGQFDSFLAKFNNSGVREWCTYYGGSAKEGDYNGDASTTLTLNADYIYLFGSTESVSEISSTGAWDESFAGISDCYLVKFGPDNQITSPTLSSNTYCQNQEFSLPYTVTGTYTAPNTFTAQLSNANGSFTNPVSLGTVSTIVSGTITCRIPIGTPAGTGYRIRIVSSNPSVTSSDNGSNITINSMPIPVITGDKNTRTHISLAISLKG